MPRYWVIAPFEAKPAELFEKVWQFDLANSLISVGWNQLGDISKLSRSQLSAAVASEYADKPPSTKALFANMLWTFYHEISPGDFVIARRGQKILAAVGKVERSAYYMQGKSPYHNHSNYLDVTWLNEPRDKSFSTIVFPRHTLTELDEAGFQSRVKGSGPEIVPLKPDETVENPAEFVLEKYLEDFIVSNFDSIFQGKLNIYEDSEGNEGQQFTTDIGSIDILAIEAASNSYVVIELKKGRSSDQVVGQVLRYMGWVKENLCVNGQSVKGLIICRDPDPKLTYALTMTSNIDVRYYSVSFKLQ